MKQNQEKAKKVNKANSFLYVSCVQVQATKFFRKYKALFQLVLPFWEIAMNPEHLKKLSSENDRSPILHIWDVEPFPKQAGERDEVDLSSVLNRSFNHFKIHPLCTGSALPKDFSPFNKGVTDQPPSQRIPVVYLKSICRRQIASKTPFGKWDQRCTNWECLHHCTQLCLASLCRRHPRLGHCYYLHMTDSECSTHVIRYFIDLPLMPSNSSDSVSSRKNRQQHHKGLGMLANKMSRIDGLLITDLLQLSLSSEARNVIFHRNKKRNRVQFFFFFVLRSAFKKKAFLLLERRKNI